ncbi:unnamed protein product [Allacma fusca]|uniref:Prolyl 4-hydroxylase alpha subunit domain-containing protein n=1 Tax=Allacma fusca TaxID=39272 RepID=A0A8J2P5K7_9HEXA|nr:unnamed protein product [Allacma fusca]
MGCKAQFFPHNDSENNIDRFSPLSVVKQLLHNKALRKLRMEHFNPAYIVHIIWNDKRIGAGWNKLTFINLLVCLVYHIWTGALLKTMIEYGLISLLELARKEFQFAKLVSNKYWNPPNQGKNNNTELSTAVQSYVITYSEEVVSKFKYHTNMTGSIKINLFKAFNDPIFIFQMLRRIAKDMRRVYNFYSQNGTDKNNILPDVAQWSSSFDANRFASSLVKLVEFYRLNCFEFASGLFRGKNIGVDLHPYHAVDLAFSALEQNRFATAVQMMSYGYTKILNLEVPESTVLIFREGLSQFIMRHDQAWSFRKNSINNGHFSLPVGNIRTFFTNRMSFHNHEAHDLPMAYETFPFWSLKSHSSNEGELKQGLNRLRRLCKGENFQNPQIKKQLTCGYKFIGIVPFTFELLSINPGIILVHEFLSPRETGVLRKQVQEGQTKYNSSSHDSKMRDIRDQVGERMTHLFSRKIQLKIDNLYINSYLSGQFFNLPSVLRNEMVGDGATVTLLYLSRVFRGGRTVFHSTGISIQPEIQAAIFYTVKIDQDLRRNRDVFHLECPVIFGQKFTATGYMDICT